MEEKFIKKDDLGEIMAELAEKVYKHIDTLSMSIDLTAYGSTTELRITIYRRQTFDNVYSAIYKVIDTLKDGFDVVDDAISSALCEVEKAQEQKNEESKENK